MYFSYFQEQLTNKEKFNLIIFNSKVTAWRENLVKCSVDVSNNVTTASVVNISPILLIFSIKALVESSLLKILIQILEPSKCFAMGR